MHRFITSKTLLKHLSLSVHVLVFAPHHLITLLVPEAPMSVHYQVRESKAINDQCQNHTPLPGPKKFLHLRNTQAAGYKNLKIPLFSLCQ